MTTDSKLTDIKISKRLSFVLRHDPDAIGIKLDAQGWTPVRDLLAALRKDGMRLDEARLRYVVETNDKRRFTLSEDGQRIRAAQGHSIEVDLGLAPMEPPAVLYHGTAAASLDSIWASGILPKSRQQVHLSGDRETAMKVGSRHGRAVVLVVDAAGMAAAGHTFCRADNGVWLTDQVPSAFLTFDSGA